MLNRLFRLVLGGSFLLLSYVFSSKSSRSNRANEIDPLKRHQSVDGQWTNVGTTDSLGPVCQNNNSRTSPTSNINNSFASRSSDLFGLRNSIEKRPKKWWSLVFGRALFATVMVSVVTFAAWQGGYFNKWLEPMMGHVIRNDSTNDDRNQLALSDIDAPAGGTKQPEENTLTPSVASVNQFQVVIAPRRDNGITKPSPNPRSHGSARIQGLFGDAGALNKVSKLIEDASELKQFAESALNQGGDSKGISRGNPKFQIPALDF